ncbi:hypothetical protein DFH06DRAFT_938792, partial [Mycena polygramma]
YPCGSSTQEAIWLPPRGGDFDHLDLSLANITPNGCYSQRISRVPGTDVPLLTAWRVYFDTCKYYAPLNQCILKRFGIKWYGNVLMVKQRNGGDQPAHVRPED